MVTAGHQEREDPFFAEPAGPGLVTSILDEPAQLAALTDEWRDLLTRSQVAQPVLTPTWLLTWWRGFGGVGGRSLRVVIFRDGSGTLVGLAPLLLRKAFSPLRPVPFRRLEFLASGEHPHDEIASNYLGVLVERGCEAAVAAALAQLIRKGALGAWDELVLEELCETDPFVAAFQQALIPWVHQISRENCGASPYIPLPATWEQYLSDIGGTKRYFVRRTMRELDAWAGAGGYKLRVAQTPEEFERGMGILVALHTERWKRERQEGAFGSDRFRQFHADVLAALRSGPDGAIELLWLEAQGRPIAALYNIVYQNRVCFYQSGRSLDLPKHVRPGIAIHILAIQRAIAMGRREYDFLGRTTFYKTQLAPQLRQRVTLRAVAPEPRARVLEAARGALKQVRDGGREFLNRVRALVDQAPVL